MSGPLVNDPNCPSCAAELLTGPWKVGGHKIRARCTCTACGAKWRLSVSLKAAKKKKAKAA